MRFRSKEHEFWFKIVAGQVRNTITKHPEYFAKGLTKDRRKKISESIAKRVVGEIISPTQQARKERLVHGSNLVDRSAAE
jgi:hypothetical protein